MPLGGLIDPVAEMARIAKEIDKANKEIATLEKKLGNADFVAQAPEEVVAEQQARLAEEQTRLERRDRRARDGRGHAVTTGSVPRLSRARAALLVVDIQERLAPAMPELVLGHVVKNTRILIEAARTLGLPIVVSQQYPKGLGATLGGHRGDARGRARRSTASTSSSSRPRPRRGSRRSLPRLGRDAVDRLRDGDPRLRLPDAARPGRARLRRRTSSPTRCRAAPRRTGRSASVSPSVPARS